MRSTTVAVMVVAIVTGLLVAGCATQTAPPPVAAAAAPEAQPAPAATPATAAPTEIKWVTSLEEGLKLAAAEKKPLVVDFFATWCGPCKMMDEETWPKAEVIAATKPFVTVRLDVDQNQEAAQRYDITGVPSVVILDATGKELDRSVGFAEAADLITFLGKHSK